MNVWLFKDIYGDLICYSVYYNKQIKHMHEYTNRKYEYKCLIIQRDQIYIYPPFLLFVFECGIL